MKQLESYEHFVLRELLRASSDLSGDFVHAGS
uniref:Uncharacterized protein n=1 Tax=Peronospora matthiolae TaxID=2874970 RepID=A0AAV1TE61_9STRA